MSKKIYKVGIAADAAESVIINVSADSSASAKAFVARQLITARLATPVEVLRMNMNEVIDAETGMTMSAVAGLGVVAE